VGDVAVPVRSLPFRIGAGGDADMVVGGGMSCSILAGAGGLELLADRHQILVNGEAQALGEGGRRTLSNGDVVAMAAGGLKFAVEDIRAEAERGGKERGGTEGSGEAGDFQALETALECPICIDTVLPEPSEP